MRIVFILTLVFTLSCCQRLAPPRNPPLDPPAVILITGGGPLSTSQSVETLNVRVATSPQNDWPDLPDCRLGHTLDGNMLCGGSNCVKRDTTTQTTCLYRNNEFTWESYPWSMKAARYNHVSWKRPDGAVQLMGGYKSSGYTSEVVTSSGSVDGFPMKYYTLNGCSIKLDEYVIIAGGIKDCNNDDCTNPRVDTVSKYNIHGWVEFLPSLNTARSGHGCGHYINSNGEVVYLVSGGWNCNSNDYSGGLLSSTEVMEETATGWSFAGDLPSARRDLVGISLDNKIFMTGGSDSDGGLSEILNFKKETGKWIRTAEMSSARSDHAITVIS